MPKRNTMLWNDNDFSTPFGISNEAFFCQPFQLNGFNLTDRCCCGQDRTTHTIVAGIEIGIAGDIWLPHKHTRPHPTVSVYTFHLIFFSEWKLYWLNRTPTAPSSFKAALIQPRLKYQQRNSSRRCFTELIPGNSFSVRATQLRHQTRIHCPTFHQRMESGAAEAAADSARWQGELWAPVEIEKGRIEFDGTLWLPLNRFAFFLL